MVTGFILITLLKSVEFWGVVSEYFRSTILKVIKDLSNMSDYGSIIKKSFDINEEKCLYVDGKKYRYCGPPLKKEWKHKWECAFKGAYRKEDR